MIFLVTVFMFHSVFGGKKSPNARKSPFGFGKGSGSRCINP